MVRRRVLGYTERVARLYPIVDVDACSKVGIQPLQLALHWTGLGVRRLQVRAKAVGSGEYLELLRQIVGALPPDVEVFANDRPDLAELAGCTGVHVGQSDLPVPVVKQTFPRLLVGVSTHDLTQLESAIAEAPSYVAFGPVFTTGSKLNPEPCVGVAGLAQARRLTRAGAVPLVAIGGIEEGNLASVREHCDYVALISALTAGELEVVTRRYARLAAQLACEPLE